MKNKMDWKMAFRNLRRNKRRTISTGLALVIASCGLALIGGYLYKSENSIRTYTVYHLRSGHLSIWKTSGVDKFFTDLEQFQINKEELSQLQELLVPYSSKIEKTAQFLVAPALLSSGQKSIPILLTGYTVDLDPYIRNHPNVLRWSPELLSLFSKTTFMDALNGDPDAISVSRGVSELIDRLGNFSSMKKEDRELTIAALDSEKHLNAVSATLAVQHSTGMPFLEDLSVNSSLRLAQNLLRLEGIRNFNIFLKDASEMIWLQKKLQADIDAAHLPLEVLNFKDPRIGQFYNGSMGFLSVVGFFFLVLVLGSSSLIISSSITMDLLERTKEMGTLRSLGFKASWVTRIYVKEALILSLMAGLVGVAFSEAIAAAINVAGWTYQPVGLNNRVRFLIFIRPEIHLLILLLLLMVSGLSSYLVAKKKTKENIAGLLNDAGASA
jgi:putative ABC transport system permease protein